ncbi:hypothetical protein AMTRI_Chr02g221970 [Amborella trichopoda]
MGVLVLILSTTYTSSLFRPSLAGCIAGFLVNLTHYDSPGSPLYNPNATIYDRMSAQTPLTSTVIPFNGEYSMTVGIGSPKIEYRMIMDTTSSIIWTQCEGCTICFPQSAPLFDPLNSDTNQKVECCTSLFDTVDRDCEETCNYAADYEDHSTSYDVFSTVTFTFETSNEGTFVTVPNVAFGCGEENEEVFAREVAGIVGVGRSSLSLINQLGDNINHKFSYCLPEQGTNTLVFGTPAHMPVLNLKSTPLLFLPNDPIYYILDLQDISVGITRLRIPQGSFDPTDEQRSLIIDSGTAYTYLHRLAYDRLSQSLDRAIRLQKVLVSGINLQLCYRVQNNLDFQRIPAVTFHFSGNNGVDEGVFCVTIVPNIGQGNFNGNFNMIVEYDLEKDVLSFASGNCSNK